MSGSGVPGGDLFVAPGPGLPRGAVIAALELGERFSKSSGPGGQGVNTTDSRVELVFDVEDSLSLTQTQRAGRPRGGGGRRHRGLGTPLAVPQSRRRPRPARRAVAHRARAARADPPADEADPRLADPTAGRQAPSRRYQGPARPRARGGLRSRHAEGARYRAICMTPSPRSTAPPVTVAAGRRGSGAP